MMIWSYEDLKVDTDVSSVFCRSPNSTATGQHEHTVVYKDISQFKPDGHLCTQHSVIVKCKGYDNHGGHTS